jgi:hypothetical protein
MEDNIKIDSKVTEFDYVDWVRLVVDGDQWRDLVNTVMNLMVLDKVRNLTS